MYKNKVKQIRDFGQSIWLDYFDRKLMDSGTLQKLIDEDGLSGITSNPAIFEKAIHNSTDYQSDIKTIAQKETDPEAIFFELAMKDISRAASYFSSMFDKEQESDGLVSLEVSPTIAFDTEASIAQALYLWKALHLRNVMIKIPATSEGIPAIRTCIREGVNINITLLFGLKRYEEVVEAYLSGLEDRVHAGLPIDHISSVASFFLSRIDVLVDPWLEEKGLPSLKGEVSIALAKEAYQLYKAAFTSERFRGLQKMGAKPQKVLWASTSTKDPNYPDTKYVDALIGPDTINTLPLETLQAFRDHGHPENRLEKDLDKARQTLEQVRSFGIDLGSVALRLEREGVEKFREVYSKLIAAIEKQKQAAIELLR